MRNSFRFNPGRVQICHNFSATDTVRNMRRTEARVPWRGLRRAQRNTGYGSTVKATRNGPALVMVDSNVIRTTSRSGNGFS